LTDGLTCKPAGCGAASSHCSGCYALLLLFNCCISFDVRGKKSSKKNNSKNQGCHLALYQLKHGLHTHNLNPKKIKMACFHDRSSMTDVLVWPKSYVLKHCFTTYSAVLWVSPCYNFIPCGYAHCYTFMANHEGMSMPWQYYTACIYYTGGGAYTKYNFNP